MPSQTLSITADAEDGWENNFGYHETAGQLVVEANSGAGTQDWSGLSFFPTTAIPAGSTITKAYLSLYGNAASSGSIAVRINVESANPPHTAWSDTKLPSSGVRIGSGHTAPATVYAAGRYFGESDTNPLNLASSFQSLVDSYAPLAINERINIFLDTADTTAVYAVFDDSTDANTPSLYLEWTEGAAALRRKGSLALLGVGR